MCSYVCKCVCVCVYIEMFLPFSIVFIIDNNKVNISLYLNDMESFPKFCSFTVGRKCVKLLLNVYSECGIEESKPTITLRFTHCMGSNIWKYDNKSVFQKHKM